MHVKCIECRYDLTGTPRTGRCPECGASAEPSYEAAESPPPPKHPATWVAMAVCAAGAVSAMVAVVIGVMGRDFTFGAVLALAVWNASPFVAVGVLSFIAGTTLARALFMCITTAALAAFVWWWYILYFQADDPLMGMIFMFMPTMAWASVIPPGLMIAVDLIRKRP